MLDDSACSFPLQFSARKSRCMIAIRKAATPDTEVVKLVEQIIYRLRFFSRRD